MRVTVSNGFSGHQTICALYAGLGHIQHDPVRSSRRRDRDPPRRYAGGRREARCWRLLRGSADRGPQHGRQGRSRRTEQARSRAPPGVHHGDRAEGVDPFSRSQDRKAARRKSGGLLRPEDVRGSLDFNGCM